MFPPLTDSNQRFNLIGMLDEKLGNNFNDILPKFIRERGGINEDYTYSVNDVLELLTHYAQKNNSITVMPPCTELENKRKNGTIDSSLIGKLNEWIDNVITPNKHMKTSESYSSDKKQAASGHQMLVIPFLPIAQNASDASETIWHWQGLIATVSTDRTIKLTFIDPLNQRASDKENQNWGQIVLKNVEDRKIKTETHLLNAQQQVDSKSCGPVLVHICSEFMNSWASGRHEIYNIRNEETDTIRRNQMVILDDLGLKIHRTIFSKRQAWNIT